MKITLQLDPVALGTQQNSRRPFSIALELDAEQFNLNHITKELKQLILGQDSTLDHEVVDQEIIKQISMLAFKALLKRDDLDISKLLSSFQQLFPKASPSSTSIELDQDHIWLKIRGKLTKVPIKDIAWVIAHEKMIKFYIQNGTMVHNQTLSKFGKWITHPDLIQVHRKYIVNFQRIEKVDLKHNMLWVNLDADLNEIPISDSFKPALLKKMQRPMTY